MITRRRAVLLPLLVALVVFLYLGHLTVPSITLPGIALRPSPPRIVEQPHHEAEEPMLPFPLPKPPPSAAHARLGQGRWHPLPVPDRATLDGRWGPHGHYCLPSWREEFDTLTQDEKNQAGEERLLACAGWEWEPVQGALREWDVAAFAERLLNSERGLLIVGDSLTGQMADVLFSMLIMPLPNMDNPFQAFSPTVHYSEGSHVVLDHMSITLNHGHPLYHELRSRLPHVPASRFDEPIVDYMRSDLLFSYDELDPIFERVGFHHAPYEYTPFASQFPWQSHLPNATARWEGEQDSILILNTGAHWSPARWATNAEEYTKGYLGVALALLPKLLATPKLHLVYRSIASAHTKCYRHSTPVFPGKVVDTGDEETDWGWAHFPSLDRIWTEELDRAAPEGVSPGGGRVDYLNVREMTAQRPEDHLLGQDGKGDCLHWCGPTVPGTWVKMLWHIMGEQ
ncbi:hypothetical protein CALCODRAFT_484482 [Calocera cornea HHB12733]|uniref:Trichome birefringence-like C-terminal domain-containing protein n=1 Tax=Calocera cornea HHB12733 TaxID=1353952 RepID=A0A165EZ09_9BASI|nr:hypothetical protein CALCODRAFT_484482 [Calocera cornea HHB12733]